MKICLYSPYIPKHAGGGEKYILDVATTLARRHSVCVAVPQQFAGDPSIVTKYEKFLDRSLERVSFVPSPLGSKANFMQKLLWTRQFDVMYFLTDGSLFFSLAKKNILHVQLPLQIDKSTLIERLKLKQWQIVNTNSMFTKQVIEPSWPVKVDLVHYPLIDVAEIESATKLIKKEKIILSVGRFFKQLHSKRQEILVEIFRKLIKDNPKEMKDWKLVFVGAVEDKKYLAQIKRQKKGLPIEFHHDLDRKELLKWYGKASIYWHAAGFDVDQQKNPEKTEHFGISTVEAMVAGCVPVVHAKGGQIEVVGDKLKDALWITKQECFDKTLQVIKDEQLFKAHQKEARKRAQFFTKGFFEQELFKMVEL
jgi:glycosyltransferase involved in cell wall biosynthesis